MIRIETYRPTSNCILKGHQKRKRLRIWTKRKGNLQMLTSNVAFMDPFSLISTTHHIDDGQRSQGIAVSQ